jgi:hypothetical protein
MQSMHKLVWMPVVLACACLAARPVTAQEPVVVVSMRSIDGVMDDLKYILTAGGNPELGDLVDGMVDQFTQGKGWAGMDRTKPVGAYISAGSGGNPDFVLFVPVSDPKKFRELLKTMLPRQKEQQGGVFSMQVENQTWYGKFARGHCFLTPLPAALNAPADPAKFADAKYSVRLHADLAKLPAEVKDGLVEQLEAAIEAAPVERPEPQGEAEVRIRQRSQKVVSQLFRLLVRDSNRLSVGLLVDKKTKTLAIEADVMPKPGSELAALVAGYGKSPSAFAALAGPDSALSLTVASPVAPSVRDIFRDVVKTRIEESRASIQKSPKLTTAAQKQAATDLIDRLGKLLEASAESAKMDAAVVMNGEQGGKAQLVAAATVREGDQFLKGLEDAAKQAGDNSRLTIDVAKVGSTRIHAVKIEADAELTNRFGDSPAHLVIRNDTVYFAVGGDSLAAIKSAIDTAGKPADNRPPISLRVRPSKLVAMFPNDDPAQAAVARKAFDGAGDHVAMDIVADERGSRVRLEFGEGFLRFMALSVAEQLKDE